MFVSWRSYEVFCYSRYVFAKSSILPPNFFGRRFDQIFKCFNSKYANSPNNEIVEILGPMRKVQPSFDMLLENFLRAYSPTECLSLDESLLLHRGCLLFRAYDKSKKARYGIKLNEFTSHDDIVLNIGMYKGKQKSQLAMLSKT